MAKISHNRKDPFANLVLDEYEQEIEDSAEKFVRSDAHEVSQKSKIWQRAAENTLQKMGKLPVSIRIDGEDLEKIKQKAKSGGVAYQTLINLLIHKYVSGEIEIKL